MSRPSRLDPHDDPHADPLLGFSPATFEARRAQVLAALGSDAMVLAAAPRLYRAGDSELPYRPDSELFYLSGCPEPEVLLVLRGFAGEARVVLFVAPRDPAKEQWDGLRLGPDGAKARLGIDDVRPNSEIAAALPELLKGAGLVHYRLLETAGGGAGGGGAMAFQPQVETGVLSALRFARQRGARTGSGPRGLIDPGGILDELRIIKDAEEIDALRAAAAATVHGFDAVLARLAEHRSGNPAVGEWQLEAELLRGFRAHGASGPAFAPIVAGGSRGCILHYASNNGSFLPGDLVLIDAGAEVRMYAGDISRTLPVHGRFTPEQRAIYDVVLAARDAAIAAALANAPFSSVHDAASLVLAEGLMALEVLSSGSAREAVDSGALRPYFPHQTSHWLGLNTHDPGDYMQGGASRALQPGMVLTVEPGLYFPPAGLFEGLTLSDPDPAAPFRGIGIRIEDDVLVTDGAPDVLTSELPSSADALEDRLN